MDEQTCVLAAKLCRINLKFDALGAFRRREDQHSHALANFSLSECTVTFVMCTRKCLACEFVVPAQNFGCSKPVSILTVSIMF